MAAILFLTQVLPYPLDAGPKVRAYHMLRYLARQHDVTLVSFVRGDDSAEAVAHLREVCAEVHTVTIRRSVLRNVRAAAKGLLTGLPIVIVRDEMDEMFALLRRLTHERAYDVIHADQLSMAGYGRYAAEASGHLPATLLDEHNAIYLLVSRMAGEERNLIRRTIAKREAAAFERYERSMCLAYDALLTVTAEDCDRLIALLPEGERAALAARMAVVPICVDPAQTPPVAPVCSGAPTILHLGTMFWPPNIQGVLWFARRVLPLIQARLPDARLMIVGKNPPPEVLALAAGGRVTVTGYVADPAPYLAAADAFIVPLHSGGGMRVKILDAWMWGLPIVSTDIGAEGIEVRNGENILVVPAGSDYATHNQDFADAVLRVLMDAELNRTLRTNGRAFVSARYSWQSLYRRVDQVYHGLLTSPKASFTDS